VVSGNCSSSSKTEEAYVAVAVIEIMATKANMKRKPVRVLNLFVFMASVFGVHNYAECYFDRC
jgi:hypothetical protein